MICNDCPRMCGADREMGERGYCGQGSELRVSRIAAHFFEEPPISGERGSGTVFFCGCSLGCVFCQNKAISRGGECGREYSVDELARAILELADSGVTNINLVTPTHFADKTVKVLERIKSRLDIPVVYNTSGYERVQTLQRLEGLVDIYLPDLKYASSELADKYSHAPDYPQTALDALMEMYRQVGEYKYAEDGTLLRGMIVRHLVLPGCRHDSIQVLRTLSQTLPSDKILLSLMSQYTPEFALECEYKELHRRLTRFEYTSVLGEAELLGFDGFMQGFDSATKAYTPDFT